MTDERKNTLGGILPPGSTYFLAVSSPNEPKKSLSNAPPDWAPEMGAFLWEELTRTNSMRPKLFPLRRDVPGGNNSVRAQAEWELEIRNKLINALEKSLPDGSKFVCAVIVAGAFTTWAANVDLPEAEKILNAFR